MHWSYEKRPGTGTLAVLVSAAVALASGSAAAEVPTVGDGASGLPSLHRVPVHDGESHRITASASVGYGWTEAVLAEDDAHHRVSGTLSFAYGPLPWLAFGLSGLVRYDEHAAPGGEEDSGVILEPRLRLRGGSALPAGFRAGAEIDLWMPGADSRAQLEDGLSVDLQGFASYGPEGVPLLIALVAGYRVDRSGGSAPNADALSLADRMALGVSDFHAVLLGLGASYRLGPAELLAEWTWDLLVGDGAPRPTDSPMRVAAGARFWVSPSWQVGLTVEVASTTRPEVDRGAPLVPIEPRVTVLAGVSYRVAFGSRAAPEPEAPTRATVSVLVVGDDGAPISGATVALEGAAEGSTGTDGRFEAGEVELGGHRLVVSAPGRTSHTDTVDVGPEGIEDLRVVLGRAAGALRVRVVAQGGRPIAGARVRLVAEGVEREEVTGEDGVFEASDIPPGETRLTVTAESWREAEQTAQVEAGGTAEVEVTLRPDFPAGQLRGTVRGTDGAPLQASIRISPAGIDLTTREDGTFEVDVPPGRYRVHVSAEGHARQRRVVSVELEGVTLLNVDLRPERRRR